MDDYFGTSGAPPPVTPQQPRSYPPGAGQWQPGYPPPSSPPDTSISLTVSGAALAAWGGVVAALLMCLGAWSPWLRIHGRGAEIDFGGLHSQLDGKWVLALGFSVLAGSVALLVTPRGFAARRLVAVGIAVVGLASLGVIVHEYVVLSDRANAINDFASFVGLHVGAGWGLWQAGAGAVCAVVAGVFGYLLEGAPAPGSASPV